MPNKHHADPRHSGAHEHRADEHKALEQQDQLDESERARSQAGEGFDGNADEYAQTGAGQAVYRATKNPKKSRKRH